MPATQVKINKDGLLCDLSNTRTQSCAIVDCAYMHWGLVVNARNIMVSYSHYIP